jgi:TM2 domain-containing membrane protein YozV
MGRRDRDDFEDPYEDEDRPRDRRISRRSRDDHPDDYIRREASNKLAAGLCGILIGGLGIHKFILGMTTPGIIMLLVSLFTCGIGWMVMHVIGVIEGIIYLTKSDEEFVATYVEGKKEWF